MSVPSLSGGYQRIEPAKDGLDSHELQLRLRLGDGHLDFVHRNTGERLLTRDERLRQETEARQAAEAEVARLRAELDRRPPASE